MKLFFWSAKRLFPLYGLFIASFLVLFGMMMVFQHFHMPKWGVIGLLIAWIVFCVAASIRAMIAQARDNAAPASGKRR